MIQPCQNPHSLLVIHWRIAIFTTTFLFIGSPNVVYGIIIHGIGIIGSAIFLRKSGAVRCTAGV